MEGTASKPLQRDAEKCYGDGFCCVYYQTGDETGYPPGYERREGTEWCKCTIDTLFLPCPNSALCGNHTEPKWVMACSHGRCMTCDRSIGGDLEIQSDLIGWECPICMESRDKACVFPDCPAKHTFCLGCMEKLIWGVPNARYNPDDSDNDECPYEGSTKACPTCRHEFDYLSDWSKTDKVPLMERQQNKN